MKWGDFDLMNSLIVQDSSWLGISNYGALENRSGVYIFADRGDQVIYIGKAGPRRMVEEISSAINQGKDWGATQVRALYTNSDENAFKLERKLIDKYNPPNNLM